MVDYKIVKFCRLCKKRFVVNKKDSKIHYCSECITKMNNSQKENEEVE